MSLEHVARFARWSVGVLLTLAMAGSVVLGAGGSPGVRIIDANKYKLYSPFVLAGAGGNLWVANENYVLTVIHAPNGSLVKTLHKTPYNFGQQTAFGTSGRELWIVGGHRLDELVELDGASGRALRSIPIAGPRIPHTASALKVVGGGIWVLNDQTPFVKELSLSTGKVVRTLPPSVGAPDSITTTASRLWVLYDDALRAYSPTTGQLLGSVPLNIESSDALPSIQVVGPNLWVAGGSRLYVVRASTTRIVEILSSKRFDLNRTSELATNGKSVWSLNPMTPSVSQFNASTFRLQRILKGAQYGFFHPDALAYYAGRLWVANRATVGPVLGSITSVSP